MQPLELKLGFDPGSSLTKVIYCVAQATPKLFVMEPELLTLPIQSLQSSLHTLASHSAIAPENQAWVQLNQSDPTCQVVGFLAQTFQAFPRLDQLKYEQVLYKLLAATGVIVQKEHLQGQKLLLRLAILLPYNEFKNRARCKAQLEEHAQRFFFQQQEINASIGSFFCSPEGGGLAQHLIHKQGQAWFNTKTSVVLMFGHRNTTCLTFERGVINPQASQTTNFGFAQMLHKMVQLSAGQKSEAIAEVVFTLGNQLQVNHPLLRRLIRSTQPDNVQAEAIELIHAIHTARDEYWHLLQSWLESIVPTTLDLLVIGGGAAPYLSPELSQYFAWANPTWQLTPPMLPTHLSPSLQHRMSDLWYLFENLFAPSASTVEAG